MVFVKSLVGTFNQEKALVGFLLRDCKIFGNLRFKLYCQLCSFRLMIGGCGRDSVENCVIPAEKSDKSSATVSSETRHKTLDIVRDSRRDNTIITRDELLLMCSVCNNSAALIMFI